MCQFLEDFNKFHGSEINTREIHAFIIILYNLAVKYIVCKSICKHMAHVLLYPRLELLHAQNILVGFGLVCLTHFQHTILCKSKPTVKQTTQQAKKTLGTKYMYLIAMTTIHHNNVRYFYRIEIVHRLKHNIVNAIDKYVHCLLNLLTSKTRVETIYLEY